MAGRNTGLPESDAAGTDGVRIQKLLARAGICSRRSAETLLSAGRVQINGETARIGQKADPVRDTILLDGKPLPPPPEYVYILLNKPRGVVTTLSDEQGRATVLDLLRDCPERVFPVGRLDRNSEGLLLLTNDGTLTRLLTHPSARIAKTYELTLAGNVPDAAVKLSAIRSPAGVKLLWCNESCTRLSVTIHEGKNRQIRRMCEQCGFHVARLRRIREHTLTLGKLKSGEWRYLEPEEVQALYQSTENHGKSMVQSRNGRNVHNDDGGI